MLTADRPPELREVGAGQTIDQIKLYGDAVKWFFEVGTHAATPERLRWMRRSPAARTGRRSTGRPGPGAPELPAARAAGARRALPPTPTAAPTAGRAARGAARPPRRTRCRRRSTSPASAARRLVAGRHERGDGLGPPARRSPSRGRLPAARRPARRARAAGRRPIAHYDALLRDAGFAAEQRPDLVLRVGDLPTSKPLRQWLAGARRATRSRFDPEGAWQDPAGVVADVLAADPARAGPRAPRRAGAAPAVARGPGATADDAAAAAIDATLGDGLTEPRVARELAHLPAEAHRVRRVVDAGARRRDVLARARRPAARARQPRRQRHRRHASPTAFGVAAAARARVVAAPRRRRPRPRPRRPAAGAAAGPPLTIVLRRQRRRRDLRLPPGRAQTDAFEEHVATPTGLDVARVAALFGPRYEPVDDAATRAALARGAAARRSLHVRTDRTENVALHRRVLGCGRRAPVVSARDVGARSMPM